MSFYVIITCMNANQAADDLSLEAVQTFLAVARTGSLAGAARALGVHHSTVFRRLSRLEQRVGAELFERDGSRYRPSGAGEAFARHARRVEDALYSLQRGVLGSDLMPRGELRFTTLETLLPFVVPALGALQARCPELTVELDATIQTRALDRREADMALRPSEAPPPEALGRRIAPLAWAVFAPQGWGPFPAIAYAGALATQQGPQQALQATGAAADGRGDCVRLRARSVTAMHQLIGAGLGQGPLPSYVGDPDPRLRRVGAPVVPDGSFLWLLRHPELRDSARIRTLIDLLLPQLEPHLPLFAGEKPRPEP
jgi:DNA-binding transcriptional LysR family regulator